MKKTCKQCKYYPKDCGYWDDKRVKPDNRVKSDTIHNCADYEK